MLIVLGWALLLVVQNYSFTIVSRARNSDSLMFHGVAAVFSNGVWFIAQMLTIDIAIKHLRDPWQIAGYAVVYIVATVFGSLTAHWMCVRFFEPFFPKRRPV